MKEFRSRHFFCFAVCVVLVQARGVDEPAPGDWNVLLNGENFDGWHTYDEALEHLAGVLEQLELSLNP